VHRLTYNGAQHMCSKKQKRVERKIHGKDGKLPGYQITADDNADNWREEIVKIRNLILESKRNMC
jgi:hypothetical protein